MSTIKLNNGIIKIDYCVGCNILGSPIYVSHFLYPHIRSNNNFGTFVDNYDGSSILSGIHCILKGKRGA